MKRAMRRAWRRDIKERKQRRQRVSVSTVAPIETDMAAYGNNDKTWDDITEDEKLQQILYAFLQGEPQRPERPKGTPDYDLGRWLEDNIAGCAAETDPGVRYYPDGSGQPPEYCENVVEPGCGEFCSIHVEE